MNIFKGTLLFLCFVCTTSSFFAMGWFHKTSDYNPEVDDIVPLEKKEEKTSSESKIPELLALFERCYPEILFTETWDEKYNDWKLELVVVQSPGEIDTKTAIFYWADGRVLPESELEHKDEWWSLLYEYEQELRSPEEFTDEEIEQLKEFVSADSRQTASGSPMFFFDFLYSADSQRIIEQHIVKVSFLGKGMKIHELILEPLKRVEKAIQEQAETDDEVRAFVKGLKSAEAYHWRRIAGTKRMSFHSYGIAIDLLPLRYGGKEVFWSWARDHRGDGWMRLPLSKRWMPPAAVIKIFEKEGFIWGGKWAIWDNMHFEYHPELIAYNHIGEK